MYEKEGNNMRKTELLIPAGSLDVLKTAVIFGADAVYLGGEAFGLRAKAKNFTNEEIKEGIAFAHEHGVRVFITANILAHNEDLAGVEKYFEELKEIKPDALIISDPGVFAIAKRVLPEIEIHISTQANNTNYGTYLFWHQMGAKRVVSARELSLKEIREIRDHIPEDMEIESFIHGAMCISYSGRCLMSNYLTGRDANRGSCAQPCRWNYALMEEKRPGQYFPVLEDERGTYIFNSKDMCLLPYLPDVIESGVDSLKIEGRMKSVHYAASVVKAYREAIDSYFENPEGFAVKKEWLEELDKVSHRAYTTGFYYGRPTEKDQIYGTSSYIQTSDFVGLVLEYDEKTGFATVEQRNNMKIGQEIEVFQPKLAGFRQVLSEMYNDEGEPIEVAPHPQQIVKIRMAQPVEPYAILRRDI